MNKQDKELLFKDLCARLPYNVRCQAENGLGGGKTDRGVLKFVGNCNGVISNYYEDVPIDSGLINNVFYPIENIKPYLRPLNTITDAEVSRAIGIITGGVSRWCERDKRWYYIVHDPSIGEIENDFDLDYFAHGYYGIDNVDFLNSHHFDYRGLIEKGLALEAPEGMYNI